VTPTGGVSVDADGVVTGGPWEDTLRSDGRGNIKKTFANICKILRNTPGWELRFNEMTFTPELRGVAIADHDIGRIREDLLDRRWAIDAGRDAVYEAVATVAAESRYHPLRGYLTALSWDGVPYLDRVPACILGIHDPGALTSALLRKWFIGAVARAMKPGCKVDTVLVLVGKQGTLKSTFFRVLAGPWFGESAMDLRNKDAAMQLYSAWIYEWPEIDRVTLSREASEVKAFLTQAQDNIRRPYMRAVTVEHRHTVIVGTTNRQQYLTDPSGARRFHTVDVPGGINVAQLSAWRDQLWAEAMHAYRAGEQWYLDGAQDDTLENVSDDHAVADPWDAAIHGWIVSRMCQDPITSHEVMVSALDLRAADRNKSAQMRVADCLKRLGYSQTRIGVCNTRAWIVKPTFRP
jgi:predicted P-loop ATPase